MWCALGWRTTRVNESYDLFECEPKEPLNFLDTGADIPLLEQTDDNPIKEPRVYGLPNRRP